MTAGHPAPLPRADPSTTELVERVQGRLSAIRSELESHWQNRDLPKDVALALDCVHEHLFAERLNVAYVRETCGLLNHNISCRFKRHVGVGMRCYIEQQRLRAAEQLLLTDGLLVTEVAWAVGYAYVESFERAFRRRMGLCPTRFRAVRRGAAGKTDR